MKILFKMMHYASALKLRFGLFLEIQKAIKDGSHFSFSVFKETWKQPHIHEEYIWLLRFVKNSEKVLLLDIGGNSGYWLELFLKYFPNTISLGFEPVKEMYDKYRERFKNNNKISVFNVALGDQNSTMEINVAKDYGLTSFNTYDGYLTSKNINFTKTEIVEIAILNAYNDLIISGKKNTSVVICKIDVQGFEIEVLKGGLNVLEKIDLLILECSFAREYKEKKPSFTECASILKEFDLFPVNFGCFNYNVGPIAYERNVLFIKEKYLNKIWGY